MSSNYQPQLFGWIGDLDKGSNYLSSPDDRLFYANDNYCAFIRKIVFSQILNVLLFGVLIILCTIIIMGSFLIKILINGASSDPDDSLILIVTIIDMIASITVLYGSLFPGLYQNLFPAKGCPIIFNRKTQKVYINESYFFNFKFWRNPLVFFSPRKRRIKEYDWANLQGVVIHNYSRNALTTTILMVCKPGTQQTIDHILLDPARGGVGSLFVWGWVNNFMTYFRMANINDGIYLIYEEDAFKYGYINGQRWPEWMVEAFNATSHEQLNEIKQKYNVVVE